MPSIISGVTWKSCEYERSGARSFSDASTAGRRHATRRRDTLSFVIWSSGAYRLLPESPPWARHSVREGPCCARRAALSPIERLRVQRSARYLMALLRREFYEHVGDVLALRHQETVRNGGRDVHDVAGRQRPTLAAFEARAEPLARAPAAPLADHGPAIDERAFPALHHDDFDDVIVLLGV